MAAVLATPPFLAFFDLNGDPLAGGKIYTYVAGTAYSVPKATYTDQSGLISMPNPIVLDDAGRSTWWLIGSYGYVIKDALGNTIDSVDNVTSFNTLADATSAYFQSFSGDGTTTAFTTSSDLGTEEKALMIYVDKGILQNATNGSFATDTGWTKGAGWTIAAGVATATGAISTAISQTAGVTLVSGRAYTVTYTITQSAGTLTPSIGGYAGTARNASGTYSEVIVAGSSQIIAFTGAGFTGTLDNVSVQSVDGLGYDIQNPSAYTINGTSLTFAVAPAAGTNNIYVFAPSLLLGAASSAAAQAQASEAAVAASAAAAAASAAAALVSQTAAAGSATSASGSATTATTQASIATTQAGIATTQATNASNSATSASGSATTATTQAGIATTQAGNALTSAAAALVSQNAAAASAISAAAFAQANIKWTFNSSTSIADPGTGKLLLNNATPASVTSIAISETNADSVNMATWIAQLDDSTHNPRSTLAIFKNPTNFAIYGINNAITDNGTWDTLPVTYITGAGTFSNLDSLYLGITLSGNDGSGGTVSTTGSPANGNLTKFTGATTISNADLTGDITTSGALATTLATVNSNVGTFLSTTVNAKGLVTAAANVTGDITSSSGVTTLATVNSNVGSFTNANITVNAKGLITAASTGTSGVDSNIFVSALRQARASSLTWSRLIKGIADGYTEQTAIGTLTNGQYNSVGKYITNLAVPSTSYANTGGTGNRTAIITVTSTLGSTGTLSTLVDGTTGSGTVAWITSDNTGFNRVFDFLVGNVKYITKVKIYKSTTSSEGNFKWQGSQDNTNWFDISTATAWSGAATQEFTMDLMSGYPGGFRYFRQLGTGGTPAGNNTFEYEFEIAAGSTTGANLALVSTGFTATSSPTTANLVLLVQQIDALTLNTDIIGKVSRDGGTTQVATTLTNAGSYDGTYDILIGSATVTGTFSTMKYEVDSANSKRLQIIGTALFWS